MQQPHCRVFLIVTPVKNKQSRTEQKEKLNCEKVATEKFF